jgi:hypothetical protein
VFLDTATMEPHEDQWAFLSTLGRLTPREVMAVANRVARVAVGSAVERISAPGSTKTQPEVPPVIHARLGAGIRLLHWQPMMSACWSRRRARAKP